MGSYLGDALAPGEYARFYVIFNTAGIGNFTNMVVSGNLTANGTVEVLNKTVPEKAENVNMVICALPAAGNPMLLMLLVLLNLVIFRRKI